MKTLRYFFMMALFGVFTANIAAQSIYEMIQNGSYYADENYIFYEFKQSDDDPITKEYSYYNPVGTDNSKENGWLIGWVPDQSGASITWDKTLGVLRTTAFGSVTNDNGYTSYMIKPGTPILKYNTQAYPYIAVKFKHLPACGEGGWQDGSEEKEKMYGGTRFHIVERAATSVTGNNQDWWMRIPRNAADQADMLTRKGDDVNEWLTIYSPNEQDSVYIFNLQGAVSRNHGGLVISTGTEANIDFYFIVTDLLSPTDYLDIEWIRSFYEEDEAKEYVDDLYTSTSVKEVHTIDADVLSKNGKIQVLGVNNPQIEVFNFLGQIIGKTKNTEIEVDPGNYIVKITANEGSKVVKLMHK